MDTFSFMGNGYIAAVVINLLFYAFTDEWMDLLVKMAKRAAPSIPFNAPVTVKDWKFWTMAVVGVFAPYWNAILVMVGIISFPSLWLFLRFLNNKLEKKRAATEKFYREMEALEAAEAKEMQAGLYSN